MEKLILFEQKKRRNYEINGILWEIKQTFCSVSQKCSKFPCCLNISHLNPNCKPSSYAIAFDPYQDVIFFGWHCKA